MKGDAHKDIRRGESHRGFGLLRGIWESPELDLDKQH
jgi:hypothetical protein